MVKKYVYIGLFTLLGVMASFLVHAGLEIPIILLLVKDFSRYGFGLTWSTWYTIHAVSSVILFIFGAVLGFQQGKFWWKVIYVERRYPWLFKK